MKKKLSVVLALVVLCLTAMAGCGACDDGAYTSVKLWYYYTGTQLNMFEKSIATFNETVGLQKKIVVTGESKATLEKLQGDLKQSASGAVNADEMPDMFTGYSDAALVVNKLVPLANFEDYFTQEQLDEYVPSYLEEGRIDGGIKVFPTAKASEMLIVNQTYFDNFAEQYNAAYPAAPVDIGDFATIEGVTELAEKYYEFTGKPLYSRDATDNYFFTGLRQLDKELFTVGDDGTVSSIFDGADRSAVRALWDNYYVPYVNGWFSHEGRFVTDCLHSGETLAGVGSTSSAAYIKDEVILGDDDDSAEDITIKILPVPVFKDGTKVFTQQGGGIAMVKGDSAKEKACVEFVKWFTEDSRNIEFACTTGYLPVKKSASDIDKIRELVPENTSKMCLDVIETALEAYADADLAYACKPFENSADVRDKVFKSGFSKKCKDDVEVINNLLQQAANETDAAKAAKLRAEAEQLREQFIGTENFNSWWESVKTQLDEILGRGAVKSASGGN